MNRSRSTSHPLITLLPILPLRGIWTLLQVLILLTAGLRAAQAEWITFGTVYDDPDYWTAYAARGVIFANISTAVTPGAAASWYNWAPTQKPPGYSWGSPIIAFPPPGESWSDVSVTLRTNPYWYKINVRAYRGPVNYPDTPALNLISTPNGNVLTSQYEVATNAIIAVPGVDGTYTVKISGVGPIDFVTIGENTYGVDQPPVEGFSFSLMPRQIIYLDFDHPISELFKIETVPLMKRKVFWRKEQQWTRDASLTHPPATISPTFADLIEQRLKGLLAANGLDMMVVTSPPEKMDDALTVRFGRPVIFDSTGTGNYVRLSGNAFDIVPRSSGGIIDRFNRRRDGEVAIFLDETQPDVTTSDIAKTIFHEAGHAFGLFHIEPDPNDPSQVMDSASDHANPNEFLWDMPAERWKENTRTNQTPADYYTNLTHNPKYHWLVYGEGKDPLMLAGKLQSGGWDQSGGPVFTSSIADLKFRVINAINVDFINLDGTPARFWDVFVDYIDPAGNFDGPNFPGPTLPEQGGRVGVDQDLSYQVVGRSVPNGPYDLVFGLGTEEDPLFDWSQGLQSGSATGHVFRIDGDTLETVGQFNVRLLSAHMFFPLPHNRPENPLVDTGPGSDSVTNGASLFNDTAGSGSASFWAGKFHLGGAGVVDAAEVWMVPPVGRLTLRLYSDDSGLPALEIFNETISSGTGTANLADPQWVSFGALDWGLAPGDYWLSVEPEPGSSTGMLIGGAARPLGAYASYNPLIGKWDEQPNRSWGFRILGTQIDEAPSCSISLLPDQPGMIRIDFSGVLQMSSDMKEWQDAPSTRSPYTFMRGESGNLYFRARSP